MQFSVGPCLRARVTFLSFCLRWFYSLPAAEGDAPCPRARVTFGRSPKSDQKRCLKPQVSRRPARLGCAENRGRVPRENQDSADRRTTNRVRPSCRCRSCVPCGGALVYRRGQKGVAPEREISPPEAKKRKQNIGGGRGRTPPLRRDRRECASIRRCADAGRRGRRPLRTHPSGCSGKRGAGDFRAYGGQARA